MYNRKVTAYKRSRSRQARNDPPADEPYYVDYGLENDSDQSEDSNNKDSRGRILQQHRETDIFDSLYLHTWEIIILAILIYFACMYFVWYYHYRVGSATGR